MVAVLLGSGSASAASEDTEAIADKVIKQLEASGALDSALDRAIERRVQRENEKRQKTAQDERKRLNDLAAIARKVDPKLDHLWGDANARISVIVYSDMECPFCKRFGGVPEAAAAKVGPQVNVVWRNFPLAMHGQNALKEAYASECVARQAGNKGFFLFANEVLKQGKGNGLGLPDGDADILAIAKQAGARNEKSFKACLEDPQTKKAIDDDMKDGTAAGINGTPGVIVRNNVSGHARQVGGAIPVEDLEAQIRGLLTESKGG
jgi:protein-disulfide isomerase